MANVTRFSAFDDTLDDLFRGFFVRPVSFDAPAGAAPRRMLMTHASVSCAPAFTACTRSHDRSQSRARQAPETARARSRR